jgi:hypothetical protein
MDLVRLATNGDVSPRHHQASRVRVLERAMKRPTRSSVWVLGAVAGATAIGAAGFASVKARQPHPISAEPAAPSLSAVRAAAEQAALRAAANEAAQATAGMKLDEVTLRAAEQAQAADEGKDAAVTVEVTPESAKIYWDDRLLEGNPAKIDARPDGKPHRLRAKANGYLTKTQIVFVDSANITVALELQAAPMEIGPVSASASIQDADSVVESMRDKLHDCYSEALRDDPSMIGSATVMLKIGENGRVVSSDIAQNRGLSLKVTTCLAYVASDAHFGSPGKVASVQIPVAFREGSGSHD